LFYIVFNGMIREGLGYRWEKHEHGVSGALNERNVSGHGDDRDEMCDLISLN
jgi:hypothetical protein